MEIEAKWTITAEEHATLVATFPVVGVVSQRNEYYDDRGILQAVGATVRVRKEAGSSTLAVKLPGTWVDGVRTVPEFETPCVGPVSLGPVPGSRALRALGVARLSMVGAMRNVRRTMSTPVGDFELDTYSLPSGAVGYEVEVEHDDLAVLAGIVDVVRSVVPGAVPSKLSKYQRFCESLLT